MGRAAELQFLREQFDAVATGGGGRLVFLSGEPGAGKTRLAREIGVYAVEQGGLFLEGHYLRDGTAAYGPWVEALRTGLRAVPLCEQAALVGPYGPKLIQAVPDLVEHLGPFPPPPALPAEELRRRLFDGLSGLISALSWRAPLVLLVDDLQWAPGLSLPAHLARRLGESRALVIGTYREQEFREQPALLRDWAELNRTRLAVQVRLDPLTAVESGELVSHYFGAGPAQQLRDPVYRQTRGNAFFIEEVLRSLTETGAVRSTEAGWEVANPSRVTIPESMKLAVEERVARQGETAQEVLRQAAVLGQEFSFPVLRGLTGLAEDDLFDVMDRAVAAPLLVDRAATGEERYAFADDQMQEVLYSAISPSPCRCRAGRACSRRTSWSGSTGTCGVGASIRQTRRSSMKLWVRRRSVCWARTGLAGVSRDSSLGSPDLSRPGRGQPLVWPVRAGWHRPCRNGGASARSAESEEVLWSRLSSSTSMER